MARIRAISSGHHLKLTGHSGSIVVAIEPSPGWYSTVVIVHYPLQALHVAINEIVHGILIVIGELQFALGDIEYMSMENASKMQA
jgi:hypothetical protein